MKRGAALLLCLLAPLAQAAGVYKWVDDKGITHFDDQNLLGERLTRQNINQREVPAQASAIAPPEFVAEVQQRCTDLRERAQSYRQATEIYARDPFGNTYKLSPTQMTLERAGLDREKNRYCRPDAAAKLIAEERAAKKQAAQRKAQAEKAGKSKG